MPLRASIQEVIEQDLDYGDGSDSLPYGFRYDHNGSIERMAAERPGGGHNWVSLCSPIEFLATTEDADGKTPGLLVRVQNDSGRWHKLAFPRAGLIGGDDLLRTLADHGLRFVPSGKDTTELKHLLMSVVSDKRARCVPHVGWHENTFVLPDEIIGQSPDYEVVFQPRYVIDHHYKLAGTLDGWQKEVATRAVGNTRLTFSISVSFAGPLLSLVGLDGGGFHWRGPSSSGKSTALHVAGSVWGSGVQSWRTTDNALEGLALAHNDAFLPLDEIAEIESRAAFNSAYMLANGQGKSRSNKTGEVRQKHKWRVIFLSTGEKSLASKIAENGHKSTAGQEVRVVDVPADAGAGMGLFESLHGFGQPSHFAEALRDATQRHYGHASRAFLTKLTTDTPGFSKEIREALRITAEKICPKDADGQVRRVANRFALAACAGELAISFGIVPWEKKTAYDAAQRCFDDWLKARGGTGKKEESDALEAVLGFIMRYSSRFRKWDVPEATIIPDCAGFVRETKEGRSFYIFREAFQNQICNKNGVDYEHAADMLAARGYMERGKDGKRTKSVRIPVHGQQRLYVVTLPMGEEEGEGEGEGE